MWLGQQSPLTPHASLIALCHSKTAQVRWLTPTPRESAPIFWGQLLQFDANIGMPDIADSSIQFCSIIQLKWNPIKFSTVGAAALIEMCAPINHRSLAKNEIGARPSMYNLFVSSNPDAWNGDPWQTELGRCVNEYTDNDIVERFGSLNQEAIAELKRLPSIFAYESARNLPPKFGIIRDVTKRQGEVRIDYELQEVDPFLSADDLERLNFDLDIGKWEMNRTHWAVKNVNLPKELHAKGITLPPWTRQATKTVDITKHNFDVALSFPGEDRQLVEKVAQGLESQIGPNSYFYDSNYVSQLAQPSLDTLLQEIYRTRSKLIVVFLSANYQKKDWCGVEFKAIREIIKSRENKRIMFVRTDDGVVDGVFETDGYVDARKFTPMQISTFIVQRLQFL